MKVQMGDGWFGAQDYAAKLSVETTSSDVFIILDSGDKIQVFPNGGFWLNGQRIDLGVLPELWKAHVEAETEKYSQTVRYAQQGFDDSPVKVEMFAPVEGQPGA